MSIVWTPKIAFHCTPTTTNRDRVNGVHRDKPTDVYRAAAGENAEIYRPRARKWCTFCVYDSNKCNYYYMQIDWSRVTRAETI